MAKLSVRQKAALDRSGALIPVGSIIAYTPGYFGAGANGGGWTVAGPGVNSVASVNSYLPANWRVCDGTAPNDTESPIFNSGSRFLPDLTGSRFLKGNTTAGTAGGNTSNQVTLSSANLPTHTHVMDHSHGGATATTGQSASHYHGTSALRTRRSNAGGADNITGRASSLGNQSTLFDDIPIIGNTDNASNDHSHNFTVPSMTGSTGNGGFANTAFSILPLYVDAFYIMRIK